MGCFVERTQVSVLGSGEGGCNERSRKVLTDLFIYMLSYIYEKLAGRWIQNTRCRPRTGRAPPQGARYYYTYPVLVRVL